MKESQIGRHNQRSNNEIEGRIKVRKAGLKEGIITGGTMKLEGALDHAHIEGGPGSPAMLCSRANNVLIYSFDPKNQVCLV